MVVITATNDKGKSRETEVGSRGLPQILSERQLDLHAIANAIFVAEGLERDKFKVETIEIPCFLEHDRNVAEVIETLTGFILQRQIKVKLKKNLEKLIFYKDIEEEMKDGHTCLYSTGLDSFSGILNAAHYIKELRGCFISHADQAVLRSLFLKQKNDAIPKNVRIDHIKALPHKRFMRRSRGVFYVLNGFLLGNRNLLICEAGPTMFQPPYTVADEVTITTHPRVLALTKQIADAVLKTKTRFCKPNENLTKSEVAASSPDKRNLKKTFSCSGTTQFALSARAHCGVCYSCIMRRLAMVVAGIEDGKYRNDVFVRKVSDQNLDNAIQLLRFSLDFLTEQDSLPWITRNVLKKFGKQDLFERYAMDNLAGLYLLSKKSSLGSIFQKFLSLSLAKISQSELKERIEIVRLKGRAPDFTNWI